MFLMSLISESGTALMLDSGMPHSYGHTVPGILSLVNILGLGVRKKGSTSGSGPYQRSDVRKVTQFLQAYFIG